MLVGIGQTLIYYLITLNRQNLNIRTHKDITGVVWGRVIRKHLHSLIGEENAEIKLLIIFKFFLDGLVLSFSQFQMLSSETPIMFATSDCMSLLSIRFLRIYSPIVSGLTG